MKHRSPTVARCLIGASIVSALGASPSLAGRSERIGPIYSSPEAIAFAQAILVKDGCLKPGDYAKGVQDDATLRATRQFQRSHFLLPTGQIDPDTMGVLTTHGPAAEPRAGSSGTKPPEGDGRPGGAKHASRSLGSSRDDRLARTMPLTGSPLATRVALGALLATSGAALPLRRSL